MNAETIVRIIMGLIGTALVAFSIAKYKKAKRKVLSVIGISFLIFAVLSWLIPTGTFSGGKVTTNEISPIGLTGFVNTPISAMVTFALYAVVFMIIGGFYGVLEKSLVLGKIVNGWAIRFEGKEKSFLIITIILFSILSSLTGLVIPLFVLVPLFAAVIFKLGFDKITALASTVGAILVGSIGSTYGFNITGYTKNLLSLDMNNQIWARVVILIVLVTFLIITILFSCKRKEAVESVSLTDDKKDNTKKSSVVNSKKVVSKNSKSTGKVAKKTTAKKTTTKKSKKTTKKTNTKAYSIADSVKVVTDSKHVSIVPFAVIFIIMIIIAFIGMYNWFYSFDIKLFSDMHEAIMGFKIGKFKLFEKLLSGASQFGYWSNVEFAGLLAFTTVVIGLVYKMKFNDFVEAFISGVKKWLPTAICVALANVVLVVLYQSLQGGTGTIVDSIVGFIVGNNDGFNPFITGAAVFTGSFFFNDLYYLLASMSSYITSFDKSSLSIAGVLVQSVYATAMMVFPTSVALIGGLSLFDVSYDKWIKYIWKFVLISLLFIMLVCAVLALL